MKAIFCDKIFDGERLFENHAVLYDRDKIDSLVAQNLVPEWCEKEIISGGILAPGFIDLQVNGGGGVLFNDIQSVETIDCMRRAHAQYGTTSFMPTLISDSAAKMPLAGEAVSNAIKNGVSETLGIHFEGPFLNEIKKGAHSADKIRPIRPEDVKYLLDDCPGRKIITLAPECTDLKTIEALSNAGVKVCIGHSNATYEQASNALSAGASCFTHLYNAMSGFPARNPGVIGAALQCQSSWCGLIVDAVHVHPISLKIALASKPKGKCFLVTDAMPTVGSDSDEFWFFGECLKLRDGQIVNKEGVLSGSHLNMAKAVRNTVSLLDIPLEEALRMASLYPADFMEVSDHLGKLKPGYQADFVCLDQDMAVIKTWKAGCPSTGNDNRRLGLT